MDLRPLLLLAPLAAAAAAQSPVPAERAPSAADVVVGIVTGTDGEPLVGARARVVVAPPAARGGTPFGHQAVDVLARQPLDAQTGADGRFTWTLTRAHRRLGTGFEPALTLLIEAEGYAPWCEPLPFGLTGFAGTRARLLRLQPDDRHEVIVDDPPRGALLRVRRLDADPAHAEARVFEVPADGVVTFSATLLPSPLVFDDWRHTRALGHEVQLWAPGRSTGWLPAEPGATLRVAATDTTTRALRVLADGAPAAAVRALYLCPDGVRRWFDLPDATAREDPCLRLVAVTAAGRSAVLPDSGSFADVKLPPAGSGTVRVPVRVLGRPAPRQLAAWFVPLDVPWTDPGARGPAGKVAVDGDDLVVELAAWHANLLVVAAAGCAPQAFPPPAGGVPQVLELHSSPFTDLRLRVRTSHDDRPAPGVDVVLAAAALARSPRAGPAPTTDGIGIAALPPLTAGRHDLLCVGDGVYGRGALVVGRTGRVEVAIDVDEQRRLRRLQRLLDAGLPEREAQRRSTEMDGEIHLEGQEVYAVATTRAGAPAAFAAATITSETPDGERRSRRGSADALGRIRVGFVGSQVRLSCRGVEVEQRTEPGNAPLPIELRVPAVDPVVVMLPPGTVVQRATYTLRGDGVRHEHVALAAGRVLLGWRDDCERCDLVLADGPPASVLRADLAAGERQRGAPVVDRTQVVRSVPLHVFCEGAPVDGVVSRPAAGDRIVVFHHREGSAVSGGAWHARDLADHRIRVFHRDHLPSAPVAVPAGSGAREAALVVELVRGARVTFRLARAGLPPPGLDVTVIVHDGGQPRYHVTLRSPGPEGGGDVELELPFALPPGGYSAEVRAGARQWRVGFAVTGTEPVTVAVP